MNILVENIDDDTHSEWINEDQWGYPHSNNHQLHHHQHHHQQHHEDPILTDISLNSPSISSNNIYSRLPDDNFGEEPPYMIPLSSASIDQNPRGKFNS